jgi:hypothetical protein
MSKIKEFMFELADKLGKQPDEITQDDFEKELIERFGVNLCHCNSCNGTFIDTNPDVKTKKYKDEGYRSLVILEDNKGHLHGCPDCLTDVYLVDYENIQHEV